MDLTNKSMLVRLSISQWSARKYDAKISEKVKSDYQAKGDVGRFNKVLIALEGIQKIQKAASQGRTFHYANTLPWEDDGIRLLPAKNFWDYSKGERALHNEFDEAVEKFIPAYPEYVEDARRRMPNGMFKESDYPSQSQLRAMFSFDVSILPLMNSDDFRVAIQADELEEIKKDFEQRRQSAIDGVVKDLWQRLYDVVGHIVERLSDKEGTFRDSLITNARELVELLPNLNITDNPDLEDMRKQIKTKICAYEPEFLRNSAVVRQQAAENAAELLKQIKGYQ